jgi:hypothetical protein
MAHRNKARQEAEDLARSVLVIAACGRMPDTFWETDARIVLACQVLDWDYNRARDWARDNLEWIPE